MPTGRPPNTVARFDRRGFLSALPLMLLLGGSSITTLDLRASAAGVNDEEAASALSASFRCPEDYSSDEAKRAAVRVFTNGYVTRFPNNNIRDMMLFRHHLLVEHTCVQTLKSILAHVSPLSYMVSMQNRDDGPRTESFHPETRVWTVYFRRGWRTGGHFGRGADLQFLRLGNLQSHPARSQRLSSTGATNAQIVGKFEAPDELKKAPAYYIVSESLYPADRAVICISKISSVGQRCLHCYILEEDHWPTAR